MIMVGVVFQSGGTVDLHDPNGVELLWNDRVICETARGEEYGRVVQPEHESTGKVPERVFRVLRKATAEDDVSRHPRCGASSVVPSLRVTPASRSMVPRCRLMAGA